MQKLSTKQKGRGPASLQKGRPEATASFASPHIPPWSNVLS